MLKRLINIRFNELAKIFDQYHRELFITAVSITKCRESAEDVVHDSLLAVANVSTKPKNLKSYLFRTVRNKALHSSKYNSRNVPMTHDFIDMTDKSPEQELFVAKVVKEIHQLSSDQQQVLIMKLFGNLTFNEISMITETSQNTVASWYRRGIGHLKEVFNEQ